MTDDPEEMTKAEYERRRIPVRGQKVLKEWAEERGFKSVIGAVAERSRLAKVRLQMRDDRVNWWEPPEQRRDMVYYYLDGEPWITFYWACVEIRQGLGLSMGVAQQTLREQCAKGVRSMRYEVGLIGGEYGPLHPIKPIKPREWLKDELDLDLEWTSDGDEVEGPEGYCVEVSAYDFVDWLAKQPKPEAETQSPKQEIAQQAIKALWPSGVPATLLNKQIVPQAEDWIKAKGFPKISRDTILRAAGRRKQSK
jgi:hypothetical protein